jgi:hypothetical protein
VQPFDRFGTQDGKGFRPFSDVSIDVGRITFPATGNTTVSDSTGGYGVRTSGVDPRGGRLYVAGVADEGDILTTLTVQGSQPNGFNVDGTTIIKTIDLTVVVPIRQLPSRVRLFDAVGGTFTKDFTCFEATFYGGVRVG